MTFILTISMLEFYISSSYLHQNLEIMKTNSYLIAEDNVALVKGGDLLRTSILTISSTKNDEDIDHILCYCKSADFTKDYDTS